MFDFDHITVVLSNRAHEHLGILHNIDQTSVNITTDMINGNQISFDVYKEMDGEVEPLWDKIVDLKYVFIPELNEGEGDYLSITSNLSDSISEKKSITAMSAGILELSQTLISMEVNTEADILREDYVEPTLFYNPEKPEASLLNRILYKLPQWSIGHVDYQLQFLQRTFSVADTSVWDFLSGDVATQFECLFVIDSIHKTINAYDLLVWCDICKTRQDFYFSNDKDHAMITCQNSSSSPIPMTEYAYGDGTKRDFTLSNTPFVDATHLDTVQVYKNNVLVTSGYTYHTQGGVKVVTFSSAPKQGEVISFKYTIMHTTQGLQYYGEDTTILIDKENLTNEIQLSVQSDQIKNTFRLSGGDDLMTATIQSLNPNGSDYITKFNQYDYDDMPHRLVTKLEQYQALYDSKQPRYQEIMENLFDALDKKIYYESGMMPYNEYTNPTLSETITRVRGNVTTVALSTLSHSTSDTVATNAVKNLAKVFMNTEIFKVEAKNVTWIAPPETPAGGTGTWNGELIITKYKNEAESGSTGMITVTVTSDRGTYLNQKVMKNLIKADDNDLTYNVLSQSSANNYQAFKNAIAQYGLVRLASFRDALQGCLDVLIQERADAVNEFRKSIYVPYQTKLNLVIAEMNTRQNTVDFWQKKVEEYEAKRDAIQRTLNLRVNLGEEDYKIYCSYRRENTYQNSNFISDGLETNELFERAKEFIDLATKELDKASTPQYTITTTLHNLINYNPDFAHIKDKFKISNWLRVKIDDEIYRLRLMSASICLGNPESLTVEFSNITSYHDVMNDVQSVLSKAQSMATSYNATQKQAGSSYQVSNSVRDFYKTGLLSAMNTLKNNNSEEITIDRYGILGRDYDMDTDAYSGEQVRLTHNMLAFTSDGWNTVSLALGKHTYYKFNEHHIRQDNLEGYGLSAEFVQAGVVNGSQIIGGDIYSYNFASGANGQGTHINLETGTFEVGGNKLVYNGSTLSIRGNITASDISGGTINVGGTNSQDSVGKNGVINVYNENNQPIIKLDKSGLTLDGSVKINFANLTGVPDYQTASQVTQITRNTVTTAYVNALNVKAGSVDAENITGTTISGKTISGGTITGTTIKGSTLISERVESGRIVDRTEITGGWVTQTDNNDNTVSLTQGSVYLYNSNSNTHSFIYESAHLSTRLSGLVIQCGENGSADLMIDCNQSFMAQENSSDTPHRLYDNTPYTGVIRLYTKPYTVDGEFKPRKLVIINGLVCKMSGTYDDCDR